MTDTIKLQTWYALLHHNNTIYNDKDEIHLFNLKSHEFFRPNDFDDKKSYLDYLLKTARTGTWYVKGLFYFYCNGFVDPVFLKYREFRYELHPGHTRMTAIGLRETYDPLPCIIYSVKGEKLLPVTGVEVLNKIETVELDKNNWNTRRYLYSEDVQQYLRLEDKHFNQAQQFWLEHTNDLYRIYFENRQFLVFPTSESLVYDKRIDLNIEDFGGLRKTLIYLFETLKNKQTF